MTHTADALKGLVWALRRIGQVDNETGQIDDDTCAECGGWTERGAFVGTHGGIPACGTDCPGHVARTALAAWESRGRLRDDQAIVDLVFHIQDENPTILPTRKILDAIEAHLFGPATKETSNG